MTTKRGQDRSKYLSDVGSIFGGLLTIVALLCCGAYLFILFEEMYSGSRDIINNVTSGVTA